MLTGLEQRVSIVSHVPCCATRVALHVTRVALHVSKQIYSESWSFSGVAAVSHNRPLKSPVALQLSGVSHVKLPLKRCHTTGGVAATLGGCRATLCNYEGELRAAPGGGSSH